MTVYYVDPVGGNDANAGTSFATRWQTLTSGATAARIAPGDEIRVIASEDPTDMAQNATWTNGSQDVTLTTAVTGDIYQSGAWTAASTNVTLTTSTNRKLGASSVSIAANATFTTGKAAYLTLSTTDFSAYQQVSFWINMTVGSMTADGDISLRLCSDTLGNTTVNTISIPRIRTTGVWQAYTVDLSGALGSSIQSIALYIDVDRGAQTFLLNNILACKASSSADSLSLTSLISKNTTNEPWFPIQSIVGTTVTLSFNPQYSLSSNVPKYYAGTTATSTLYKRQPIILPSAIVGVSLTTVPFGTITDTGTSSSPLTYSGGWNRTDMSTQTGETYISGVNCQGAGIMIGNAASYLSIEKINPFNFGRGFWTGNNSSWTLSNSTISIRDISHNSTTNIGLNQAGGSNADLCIYNTFDIVNCIACGAASTSVGAIDLVGAQFNTIDIVNLSSNYSHGITLTSSTVVSIAGTSNNTINITNCSENGYNNSTINGGDGVRLSNASKNIITIENAENNYISSVSFVTGSNGNTINVINYLNSSRQTSSVPGGVIYSTGGSSSNVLNLNSSTITAGSNSSTVYCTAGSNMTLYNGTLDSPSNTRFIIQNNSSATFFNPTLPSGSNIYSLGNYSADRSSITFGNYNGSTTDQRTYIAGSTDSSILTDTSVRHTASGVSWKMTVGNTDNVTASVPLVLPLAQIAVNASSLVTAKVWVYRTDTNLVTKFVCPGGQISGVTNDVVATASGAVNTWEQLTITFTPSAAGVVGLQMQCYGAAASVYVDDFEATQA